MRELMRADVQRSIAELALRPRQRALVVALLDISRGNSAPSAEAEELRTELGRRGGATVSAVSFRQQLTRLNRALDLAHAPFAMATRAGRVVAEPSSYWDRASQLDSVRQALVEHSGEKMRADIDSFVSPRAAAPHLLVMWSYAWLTEDQQAVQLEIYDALKAKLATPPARYQHLPRIELWRDEERLNLGDEGTAQMDEACARAFLGLLVYSDKYPHSAPCKREVDHFLDAEGRNVPDKRSIVIRFNCAIADMQPRFLTRIVYPGGTAAHMLDQWAKGDVADRHRLINEIATQIFDNAAEFSSRQPAEPPSAPESNGRREKPNGRRERNVVESFMARQPERMLHDDVHSTPPLARSGAHGYDVASPQGADDANGVDIVEKVIEWSASPDPLRARITALLGDFGMGKTVTCQLVCRRMIERLNEGEALPTPVYFDLRDIPRPERPEQVTLETMIEDLLRQSGEAALTAGEVIDFIRSRDVLVIFDGLDEITNKYSLDVARAIYRQLIGVVPASIWREDAKRRSDVRKGTLKKPSPRVGPSILLSCRSQYFADFAAERGFFSDADRFGLKLQEDIATYVMLPFNQQQIRDYIARNLAEEDRDRALSLIESTYDLGELARRPILLRYIGELIHRIEAEKLAGRHINLSRLYDILVRQAFERDSPKHVIPIPDKKKLLQALALHLHRRRQEDISNERLIEWLDDEITASFPKLARALRGEEGLKLSEIFLQDLRNATLLSRPAESGFRFGHTSLREFFLGNALYDAVIVGKAFAVWDVHLPSRETFDFLLQRHATEQAPERKAFERGFRALLEAGAPVAVRWMAFTVWRQGFGSGEPLPAPDCIDCSGFDLHGGELAGSPSVPLPLSGSLWRGANLAQATFEHVDLSDTDFDEVKGLGVKFVRCSLAGAHFNRALLAGTIWRDCHLDRDALKDADLDLAQAHGSTLGGAAWRPQPRPPAEARKWRIESARRSGTAHSLAAGVVDGRSVLVVAARKTVRIIAALTGVTLRILRGHDKEVRAVAFHSDGARRLIASGGGKTVRIWDADSGEALKKFEIDSEGVNCVAFATINGALAVAAGTDNGLRVWNVETGERLAEAGEPSRTIRAIAVAESGGRTVLAVAEDSGGIALWDLESSQMIREFDDEKESAYSVEFLTIDGELVLLSGGDDDAVRLRNVRTGNAIRTLEGHLDWVRSVTSATVGGRTVIVSGGDDQTIRIWDARTGESLAICTGHESWVRSLTIIMDGPRPIVVSGGDDGSIRSWELPGGEAGPAFGAEIAVGGTVSETDPDGRVLAASASEGSDIRIWDATTGALRHQLRAPSDAGAWLSLDVAGGKLWLSWCGMEGRVCVWDASTGQLVHNFVAEAGGVHSVMVETLDGVPVMIVTGGDGTVSLSDLVTGKPLGSFTVEGSGRNKAMLTMDGTLLLVTPANEGLKLLDVKTGEVVRTFGATTRFTSAITAADIGGRKMIAASVDGGTIRFWDAATGELSNSIDLDVEWIASLHCKKFKGRDLIGWSAFDGRVGINDALTGEPLLSHGTLGSWPSSFSMGEADGRLYCTWIEEGQIMTIGTVGDGAFSTVRLIEHKTGASVTLRQDEDGEDRLLAIHGEAWKYFSASYWAGSATSVTIIDDMPRAAVVDRPASDKAEPSSRVAGPNGLAAG